MVTTDDHKSPYMGAGVRNKIALFLLHLWITRGKLWIIYINCGKLPILQGFFAEIIPYIWGLFLI